MIPPLGANKTIKNRGCVLLVTASQQTIETIKHILSHEAFFTLVANNEEQAQSLIVSKQISYVLLDTDLVGASSKAFISTLRKHIGDRYIPIIALASSADEDDLYYCISVGCDDFLIKPLTSVSLIARISTLQQRHELQELYNSSVNEQLVARQILSGALDERTTRIEEIKLLSRSKAIFSGDLFITARNPDGGLNILLADFTGHGLPAAIGALPVADIFYVMTEKGFSLDRILENINSRLHTLLPTNMFMACIALNITSNLKQVKIWNGGMPDIYIRERKTGGIGHKIKSTHLPLGIDESILNRYKLITIDLTPDDELILYSDGLTEAQNADGAMFGYLNLDQCLEKNQANESIFTAIVDTFDTFCDGVIPMDDITLACIPCDSSLLHVNDIAPRKDMAMAGSGDHDWCWYMELSGPSLHMVNPIPIVLSAIKEITGRSTKTDKLSDLISMLYKNTVQYIAESTPEDKDQKNNYTNSSITNYAYDISIRIGIKKIEHKGEAALLVRMENNANGIDHKDIMSILNQSENNGKSPTETAPLVCELNKSSSYQGRGNRLEAIICECL